MSSLPSLAGDDLLAGITPPRIGFASRLSRRQKAAIVVRVLLAQGAELSLADLPDELQDCLTREMGEMGFVDRETVGEVLEEFIAEIDAIGISFPRGLDGALAILGGALSPSAARRLRKQAGMPKRGDPWPRIAEMDLDQLSVVMERESIEVCAVLLSKLPVEKAAKLLARLPGPQARRITYAVSLTESIGPDAVRVIGFALASQLESLPGQAFSEPPVARVGAILNVSPATTRDDVLEGLDETDADFAEKVRKAIFTYANIPTRVAPGDIPKVMKVVDRAVLVTAMAGAQTPEEKAVGVFFMESISKRLAAQIEEETAEMKNVKPADAEAAMGEVVAAIRKLQAEGELFLID